MSLIKAEYRMELYASDGVTVLTPAAGAAHSDSFAVTTQVGGDTGWKPYLSRPQVRFGSLDPLTAKTSIGQATVKVLDAKVGTDNLVRWVTAFLADAKGVNQWKGRKVRFLERLTIDGVAGSWTDYFVGRLHSARKQNPRNVGPCYEFIVKAYRTDESRNVFEGQPHDSITYAYPCPLLPIGMQEAWRGKPTIAKGKGTVKTSPGGTKYIDCFGLLPSGTQVATQRTTRALAACLERRVPHPTAAEAWREITLDAKVRVTTGGNTGDFYLTPTALPGAIGYDGEEFSPLHILGETGIVTSFGIVALDSSHPMYLAMPSDATSVEWYIYNAGPPIPDAPLFIDEVHPGTFWKDLLDGYFSRLKQLPTDAGTNYGDRSRSAIPYDSAAFTALIADTSIPKLSGIVRDIHDLNVFVERFIGNPLHLASRINGSGAVVPVDYRIPDPSTISTTIGSADFIHTEQQGPEWDHGRDSLSSVSVKYVRIREDRRRMNFILERESPPFDVSPSGFFFADPAALIYPSESLQAFDLRDLPIDASLINPQLTTAVPARNEYLHVTREPLSMFGAGATYLSLPCRRTTNTDLWPGEYVIVDIDPQPNPNTNEFGGERLMLVIDRFDNDNGTRQLELIDAGPSTAATAPTVGALAANATTPEHAIDVPITLNADSEAVEIWVNTTATSVGSDPAATDAGWRLAQVVTTTATHTLNNLPAGKRHWIRARTRTPGKPASSYATSSGTNYQDSTALTAPSALSASVSSRSIVLTWTVGETAYPVMPTLTNVNALAAPLPPGSTRFVFDELAASTLTTVGVKHVDAFGGESSESTTTATTSTSATIDPPRTVHIVQGDRSAAASHIIPEQQNAGYGLHIAFSAARPDTYTKVEVSTSSTFASIESVVYVEPGKEETFVHTPLDGQLRYVRAYHERDTFTTSSATDTVSAYPVALSPGVARGKNVSKKIRISASAFVPRFDTDTVSRNVGQVSPRTFAAATDYYFHANVVMPANSSVTITGMRLRGYKSTGTDVNEVFLSRLDDAGSGTTLGTATIGNLTGYNTTSTTSFSETTAGRSYNLVWHVVVASALDSGALVWVELDYTAPEGEAVL